MVNAPLQAELNTRSTSAFLEGVQRYWLFAVLGLTTLAVLLAAPASLGVDGTIHIWMVDAMVNGGHLHIAERGGVAASPELQTLLSHDVNGRVMPQYPSGYAVFAAPFYWALGIKGLLWINAFSFMVVLWATRRIALGLYGDETLAWIAVGLTGAASLLPGYAFIILPHMSSLALTLVAIERCVSATRRGATRPGLDLALAGLALGAGLNLRVDVILAIAAVFVWLRVFGLPGARRTCLFYLLGLVPGLLFASVLNDAKFGTFVPISYGPKGGADGVSNYGLPAIGLGMAFLAVVLVDVTAPRFQVLRNKTARFLAPKHLIWGGGVVCAAVLLLAPLRELAFNIYVLVVNLQSAGDWQVRLGLSRDEFGFASFYGLNKKALLQSMPFAVLLLVPAVDLVRGRNWKTHSLGFGVIAAVVLFYSLSQWHGGLGMNMRYFIPAVPFVAILSAFGLVRLIALAPPARPDEQTIRLGILLGIGLVLMSGLSGTHTPAYKTVVFYAPLILSAGLLVTLTVLMVQSAHSDKAAPAFAWFLAVGVGHSGAIGVSDAAYYHSRLAGTHATSQATVQTFPDDALVVSSVEEMFLHAKLDGLNVTNPRGAGRLNAVEIVKAHQLAERCVYLHGFRARGLVEEGIGGAWVTLTLPGQTGPMAEFEVHEADTHRCAFKAN
ncbi:MAG: hypothetical protein AAF216_00105 [Pseudomonadota bacterium]